MKNKRNLWLYGIIAFSFLFIASAVIFKIFDFEILPSQFYGALIGVVITAIITVFLLQGQTANEMARDKDVKIFEQKILIYSAFTKQMWAMLDDSSISDKELKELRNICFRELVFYLNKEQIQQISSHINNIDIESEDATMNAVSGITHILQNNLNKDVEIINKGELITLFNSFNKTKKEEENIIKEESNLKSTNINYWHFNILSETEQIKAFENNNLVLALLEYGEDWRTNLVKQIKPDDVIFLFKRGGSGYIGAFKALNPTYEILYQKDKNVYSIDKINKYDIYKGLEDGASLCTNIFVEPIAFNYKGVGYKSVRRRTIERIYDKDAVTFLLNRFNGKDLNETQLKAKGKLNENTYIDCDEIFFNELINKITK